MSGASYLLEGFRIAVQPKVRWFVLLPLVINVILFSSLIAWGLNLVSDWQTALIEWLPNWLDWLSWLLQPLFWLASLLALTYGFTTVANFIAAPFNGLLADIVEAQLNPSRPEPDASIAALLRSVPRAIQKELAKIGYYLPRALLVFILGFIIPGANVLLWFVLGAWMMSLQYLDYPMDNHQHTFKEVKQFAKRNTGKSFSFGGLVLLLTSIPLINLVIMPVAVCGATKYWVNSKELK